MHNYIFYINDSYTIQQGEYEHVIAILKYLKRRSEWVNKQNVVGIVLKCLDDQCDDSGNSLMSRIRDWMLGNIEGEKEKEAMSHIYVVLNGRTKNRFIRIHEDYEDDGYIGEPEMTFFTQQSGVNHYINMCFTKEYEHTHMFDLINSKLRLMNPAGITTTNMQVCKTYENKKKKEEKKKGDE